MSIFNPNIIQDESDIIRRKIYEDMIRCMNQVTFEMGEKINTKIIEDFDKMFVLKSNFI